MTRYRIGVKAIAIHYYEIEADSLDDALDTWTDGDFSHDTAEVVGEDGPVFAERFDEAENRWVTLELPSPASRD